MDIVQSEKVMSIQIFGWLDILSHLYFQCNHTQLYSRLIQVLLYLLSMSEQIWLGQTTLGGDGVGKGWGFEGWVFNMLSLQDWEIFTYRGKQSPMVGNFDPI